MRFYVASWTRVGSTWVSSILQNLLELSSRYESLEVDRQYLTGLTPAMEEELLAYSSPNVIKTHSFVPYDLLPLTEQDTDNYIVIVKRNFLDAFVSKYFYERYTRAAQNLEIGWPYRDLLEMYPEIPDGACLELLVEAHAPWVEEQIREWCMHSHTIVGHNIIVVDYDKYNRQTEKLTRFLNQYVRASNAVVEKTVEECSFVSMKKKHTNDFVRKAVKDDWRNYIDEATAQQINNKVKRITKLNLKEI